jgi:hypothetical protein
VLDLLRPVDLTCDLSAQKPLDEALVLYNTDDSSCLVSLFKKFPAHGKSLVIPALKRQAEFINCKQWLDSRALASHGYGMLRDGALETSSAFSDSVTEYIGWAATNKTLESQNFLRLLKESAPADEITYDGVESAAVTAVALRGFVEMLDAHQKFGDAKELADDASQPKIDDTVICKALLFNIKRLRETVAVSDKASCGELKTVLDFSYDWCRFRFTSDVVGKLLADKTVTEVEPLQALVVAGDVATKELGTAFHALRADAKIADFAAKLEVAKAWFVEPALKAAKALDQVSHTHLVPALASFKCLFILMEAMKKVISPSSIEDRGSNCRELEVTH